MPIDHKNKSTLIYQRNQYGKGGISRLYWDYRDSFIFGWVSQNHKYIIDMGCGEGITLERLLSKFPERNIRGIDPMPENIKICRQNNLPAYLGSVYDEKIEKDSCDLCVFSEVIEHLEKPDLAIMNIYRILKPGGNLIIVFPHDRIFKFFRILFLKIREAFVEPGHLNQFTPKFMINFLQSRGFDVLKIKNIPFLFWFLSLHCIILARKKQD